MYVIWVCSMCIINRHKYICVYKCVYVCTCLLKVHTYYIHKMSKSVGYLHIYLEKEKNGTIKEQEK